MVASRLVSVRSSGNCTRRRGGEWGAGRRGLENLVGACGGVMVSIEAVSDGLPAAAEVKGLSSWPANKSAC